MAAHPLISIGMTCFNAQSTIAAALESAQAQEWDNIEIIVIDDASSDDSCEIIKTYPGVRVHVMAQNGGVAAARNKIIEMAHGDFIAFFDDDDVSAPERLARQYERMIECETDTGVPVLCHSARRQIYPGGATRYEGTIGMDVRFPAPQGEIVARRILTGKPFPNGRGSMATCSQMARTNTYRTLGGFDPAFRRSEDTDLAVRHALNGGAFTGIAEPLVTQRMTRGDEKTIAQDLAGYRQLFAKHAPYLEDIGDDGISARFIDIKQALFEKKTARACAMLAALTLRHPLKSVQKIGWALPNIGFTRRYKNFQQDAA